MPVLWAEFTRFHKMEPFEILAYQAFAISPARSSKVELLKGSRRLARQGFAGLKIVVNGLLKRRAWFIDREKP